jgi:hypothetical protein
MAVAPSAGKPKNECLGALESIAALSAAPNSMRLDLRCDGDGDGNGEDDGILPMRCSERLDSGCLALALALALVLASLGDRSSGAITIVGESSATSSPTGSSNDRGSRDDD